mmetsp:Transcript_81151/g.194729  ORF Transcript_81151/g.194729 Transcript_81151/m.194729 type:complete len:274 (+) Transcript_81151:382-1203(+)
MSCRASAISASIRRRSASSANRRTFESYTLSSFVLRLISSKREIHKRVRTRWCATQTWPKRAMATCMDHCRAELLTARRANTSWSGRPQTTSTRQGGSNRVKPSRSWSWATWSCRSSSWSNFCASFSSSGVINSDSSTAGSKAAVSSAFAASASATSASTTSASTTSAASVALPASAAVVAAASVSASAGAAGTSGTDSSGWPGAVSSPRAAGSAGSGVASSDCAASSLSVCFCRLRCARSCSNRGTKRGSVFPATSLKAEGVARRRWIWMRR